MRKAFLLSAVLLLCCLFANGQKYELGKVTSDELKEKRHPKDTAAVAAVLFRKARTVFKYSAENGFVSYTDFAVKIKIYKKEGIHWANFEIPFYTGYAKLDPDLLNISHAYTYNLENGKVEKTKVSSEGKYEERFNESWKTKSVVFPNVTSGSVIELKYTLKTQNLSTLPDFQYQYKIPVNYAEYTTEIPEFYIYKAMKSGYAPIEMKEKLEGASQNYTDMADKAKIDKTMTYHQIKTTYTAQEIPALIEEEYVDNMENYYGKIEHELQRIRYPNEPPKEITTTWESVAKSIYQDKDFGAELNKNSYFLNDLRRIVGETTAEGEKADKVFGYVKSRMNWNGKYGYYTRNGVEKAYGEKSGNAAEINLMLVAMFRMAGLQANPVLVSTRDNGIALFPNSTKFNYVIAMAEIDGKTLLFDATSKKSLPGILPIRDLNWVGRMIKNDGSSTEIDLMPHMVSKDVASVIADIRPDGTLTGKLREHYYDYNAFDFRENYADWALETQLNRVERKYKGLEVADYSIAGSTEMDKPVVESYSFTHAGIVESIGDKMFFSPLLFFALIENPFRQEDRQYPVNFAFPNQDKLNISITVPDGYVVETLPKPKVLSMPENFGAFKYNISSDNNKIQLVFSFEINRAVISPEYYNVLKNFYKEMIEKQQEKIVLKKI